MTQHFRKKEQRSTKRICRDENFFIAPIAAPEGSEPVNNSASLHQIKS